MVVPKEQRRIKKDDKMNWKECNFREHGEYELLGLFSKKTETFNLCMLKNNTYVGNKNCDKEKCVLMKLINY